MANSEDGYVSIQKPLSGNSGLLKVFFTGNQTVAIRAARNMLSYSSETSAYDYVPDDVIGNNFRSVWAMARSDIVEISFFTEIIEFEAHNAYMDAMEFVRLQANLSADPYDT